VRYIVFSKQSGAGLNLWLIAPDGSEAIQITSDFKRAAYSAWSPDRSLIAFASNDTGTWHIYTIDPTGENLTQITDFSSADPDWSPDGGSLIFQSDHRNEPENVPDIYAINLDGSNLIEILDNPELPDFDPGWSPNGTQIMFGSNRTGISETFVMNANGENITQLIPDEFRDYYSKWSPDGSKILFISDRNGNPDLYVMDVDGSNVIQLTDDASGEAFPSWSPDGTRIVYASDQGGNWDLYIVDVDVANIMQLTDDDAIDLFPDW